MSAFEVPPLPDLVAELQQLFAQVPAGNVTTYGDLAKALGNVVASRWIASFLLHDPEAAAWPSHRVVRADGSLGLHAHGDAEAKAERLCTEGVRIRNEKVDLKLFGIRDFQGNRPLAALRNLQDELPIRCRLSAGTDPPATIGGLDVSYAADQGVGGYTLVDAHTGELIWSTTARCEIRFPYISSYLAFRELPVLAKLYTAARDADRLADVYMIDGAGIMHPRRAGIATHFGILADVPTIGVTKKLLSGKFDSRDMAARKSRDVCDGQDHLGVAIRPRESSKKFIWVSPGHRLDIAAARDLTLSMLLNRRLPEPIYWADRLSRDECRRILG